jgi:hypothetical protein
MMRRRNFGEFDGFQGGVPVGSIRNPALAIAAQQITISPPLGGPDEIRQTAYYDAAKALW